MYNSIMTTSEVKIIYNEKYKRYIKKLQHRFKNCLNSMYAYDLLNDQEVIRDYILDHKQNIDFTEDQFKIRPHNMQEIFIIMVSIVSDVDICDSLTEIVHQKMYIQHPDENEEFYADLDDSIPTCCACGHGVHIDNSPIIHNTFTKKFLLIGCDCALKNKILTKDEVREIKKQRKRKIEKKKQKAIDEKIRVFQEKQNLKLKQNMFNVFKNEWVKQKAERKRLNTPVYLSIPPHHKNTAIDFGCAYKPDIKKWCITTELYESNPELHIYNLYTPAI